MRHLAQIFATLALTPIAEVPAILQGFWIFKQHGNSDRFTLDTFEVGKKLSRLGNPILNFDLSANLGTVLELIGNR